MHRLTRDEVRRHVEADAVTLYALVSDVTRTPEWSPQVVACEWVPPATGPVPGARFRATNKGGGHRWSNRPVVEIADPGREFAFTRSMPLGGTLRWSYRFEPADGGTTVTESYAVLRPVPAALHWIVRLSGVRDLAADLRANMRRTLERLAVVAEREAAQRRPHS